MATTIQTFTNHEVPVERGGEAVQYPGAVSTFRMKFEPTPQTIHDVRGHEPEFTLNRHGFEFHQHESKDKMFHNDEAIKQQVYDEVVQLLKDKYVHSSSVDSLIVQDWRRSCPSLLPHCSS